MKPVFPFGVEKVDASYQSPYGMIKSNWIRNRDRFVWYITIPANTTATVELPASFKIRQPKHPGLLSFEKTDDLITINLGSGRYELCSE
jgi:alpha-L-rhamnosidase